LKYKILHIFVLTIFVVYVIIVTDDCKKVNNNFLKGVNIMRNQDIRQEAKSAGVRLWQIAERLGIQDANFSRKLRHELPYEDKRNIFSIIASLKEGMEGVVCNERS